MYKASFLTFAFLLILGTATAQKSDHVNGGGFTKTVSYNAYSATGDSGGKPVHILEGKGIYEKIFFGFTNSPVEFIWTSVDYGAGGLRLYKSCADNRWALEIIPLDYYGRERSAIEDEIEPIEIPFKYLNWLKTGRTEDPDFETEMELRKDISPSLREKLDEQNEQAYRAKDDERTYTSRRHKTKTFIVDRLGDLLYERTVAVVGGFRAEGVEALILNHHSFSFSCVVGGERWTLSMHGAQNKTDYLSDICLRIILDADKETPFDEGKYIAYLESLDSEPIEISFSDLRSPLDFLFNNPESSTQ